MVSARDFVRLVTHPRAIEERRKVGFGWGGTPHLTRLHLNTSGRVGVRLLLFQLIDTPGPEGVGILNSSTDL